MGFAGTWGVVGFCRMRENSTELCQERQRADIGNSILDGEVRHRQSAATDPRGVRNHNGVARGDEVSGTAGWGRVGGLGGPSRVDPTTLWPPEMLWIRTEEVGAALDPHGGCITSTLRCPELSP